MKAVNIQWDTDGVDVDLPSEIEIPSGMVDDDEISDYLTNKTGYCHFGYELGGYELIERPNMDISQLCYELYKIDWKYSHMITPERQMDSLKNYFEDARYFPDGEYSYNDYLEEHGYDGELYACYDEFCETEYLDKEYIEHLLDNEKLFAVYCADINDSTEL